MRIKRLYLLLIFVFSILMTNLHISNMKPSLTYEKTPNLITLVDNVRGSQVSLIALDLSDHDHSFVVSDIDKDYNPLSVIPTLVIINLLIFRENLFKKRELRGLDGIVFWYKKRVLRN